MHWSGKVFAWLLIPLILAGMVLSAKLVRVRNSYAAKLDKAKKEYNDAAPKVDEARAALNHAQAEWHRATQTWGNSYLADTTVQNPATGQLTVALGVPQIQEKQWLYGFEVMPDGSSIYRGDFVADVVREGQSILKPNWRLRPGDTEGWQGGRNWRWRPFLPSAYPNQFDEFEQALLQKDELLADRQQTLDIQKQLIASATEQLKMREAELVGGPELPQDATLDVEFRKGLTAALEELEETRNGELIAVDRLRRSVRDLHRKIQGVQEENRELVRQLPQPTTEVTRKP